MRATSFFILPAAAATGILLCASAPASAASDPYRWCAQYGPDGGRNCGFVTLQQCLDTISGVGGGCELNQFYTGPEPQSNPRKPKPHKQQQRKRQRHGAPR